MLLGCCINKLRKNMFQLKSICVLLVLLAVHTSVKGQWSSDGRTWGDSTFISQPGCVAVHSYEIYEDSTMHGAFSETMYNMWKTCADVLGYTDESPYDVLRMQLIMINADSQGNLLRLRLRTTRAPETNKERKRMRKLVRLLKKTKFPPFDRKDSEKNMDRLYMTVGFKRPHSLKSCMRLEGW